MLRYHIWAYLLQASTAPSQIVQGQKVDIQLCRPLHTRAQSQQGPVVSPILQRRALLVYPIDTGAPLLHLSCPSKYSIFTSSTPMEAP